MDKNTSKNVLKYGSCVGQYAEFQSQWKQFDINSKYELWTISHIATFEILPLTHIFL